MTNQPQHPSRPSPPARNEPSTPGQPWSATSRLIEASGVTGRVTFDGHTVRIYRETRLARMSGADVALPIASLARFRWKQAGVLVRGNVNFDVPGGQKYAGQVLFTKAQEQSFLQLRQAVEAALARRGPVLLPPPEPATVPERQPDPDPSGRDAQMVVAVPSTSRLERWSDRLEFLAMGTTLIYLLLPLLIGAVCCIGFFVLR